MRPSELTQISLVSFLSLVLSDLSSYRFTLASHCRRDAVSFAGDSNRETPMATGPDEISLERDPTRSAFSFLPTPPARNNSLDHRHARYSLVSRPTSTMRSTCPSPSPIFDAFPQS